MEIDIITIIHGVMFFVAFAIMAISFLDDSL